MLLKFYSSHYFKEVFFKYWLCFLYLSPETILFCTIISHKIKKQTSLMAHWRSVCLPMQGTQFYSWSRKIPHAAEPLSLCAIITEGCKPRACASPHEKPPQQGARTPGEEQCLLSAPGESPCKAKNKVILKKEAIKLFTLLFNLPLLLNKSIPQGRSSARLLNFCSPKKQFHRLSLERTLNVFKFQNFVFLTKMAFRKSVQYFGLSFLDPEAKPQRQ